MSGISMLRNIYLIEYIQCVYAYLNSITSAISNHILSASKALFIQHFLKYMVTKCFTNTNKKYKQINDDLWANVFFNLSVLVYNLKI